MKFVAETELIDERTLLLKSKFPIDTKSNEKVTVSISKYRSNRSIEQNKLMWKLISEIDKKINGGRPNDPIDVYIQCLERANAKYCFLLCIDDGLEILKKEFRAIRVVGEQNINGIEMLNVQCFLGSSKMNTKEMANLIDCVLDYASELEIHTKYWEELLK